MSHYEQRLSADLEEIRTGIEDVAGDVVSALERTVRGIREADRALLHDVVLDDNAINRRIRAIDSSCHAFVARHLPAAGHLRFVSSVLRLNIALERAGDYAVTISRVVLQLDTALTEEIVAEVAELAALSGAMLRGAVEAFLRGDAEQAREVRTQGIRIDRLYDSIFHGLVEEQPRRSSIELASLLTIFGKIERFSDQAKNICEEAVFAGTGEIKTPKVFRILFLDRANDFVGPLAAAIATKSFSAGGVFTTAGREPAEALDPRLVDIASDFGLDIGRARPTKVRDDLPDYPIDYHVVVAIGPDASDLVPRIPYHTALQLWHEFEAPGDAEGEPLKAQADTLVHGLTERIGRLMERLRGPG
ncbi:MAG: phosphate signaling complex protein PhoU [Myxococcota bacterium]